MHCNNAKVHAMHRRTETTTGGAAAAAGKNDVVRVCKRKVCASGALGASEIKTDGGGGARPRRPPGQNVCTTSYACR